MFACLTHFATTDQFATLYLLAGFSWAAARCWNGMKSDGCPMIEFR